MLTNCPICARLGSGTVNLAERYFPQQKDIWVKMMMNLLMSMAENPMTPWIVLSGAGLIILTEAWKESHATLMGDMFADGADN